MAALEALDADDKRSIAKQYACALQGLQLTWSALQLVEKELAEIAPLTSVPIGKGALLRTRDELRKVIKKALDMAKALDIPPEQLAQVMSSSETSGADVGRVTKEQAQLVDVAPGASFITLGENISAKAIAKLGARRAVGAAESFARFSGSRVKVALAMLNRGASAIARGPFGDVAKRAMVFFAAAAALRFALTGGKPLLSSPVGIALAALAVFVFFNRR